MFKVLASLLLFLVLYCRTTMEELSSNCPQRSCNGTTAAGPSPTPSSGSPQLPQQEVDAVNTLLDLAPTSQRLVKHISVTDCNSTTFRSIIECSCNNSTNACWVTTIDLHNFKLSGRIPENIGNLAYLESLDLSGNYLNGQIPESFRNLSRISEIDLSSNHLSGTIPNCFQNLSQITEIILYDNYLGGAVPIFFSEMKNLTFLDLRDNFFNGSIPREFGTSPALELLYLDDNFLCEGIPDELANISSLTYLSFTNNQLSGQLPQQLGNLSNLDSLYLENNLFSGKLPPSLESLKNLVIFIIQGNDFSGRIPDFISKWQNLQELDLRGNNFEAPIPDAMSNLSKLKKLSMNDMVGADKPLFPRIQNYGSLQLLTLRNCSLTGPIPDHIWKLKSLTYLDLSFNSLVGGIPPEVDLPNIQHIFLRRNNLNGSLPVWLTELKNIYVDVSENSFTNVTIPKDAFSPRKNFFACCSKVNTEGMNWLETNYSCGNSSKRYEHLYINCGGNAETINGSIYEADLDPNGESRFYLSSNGAWGFSSMGIVDFKNQKYTLNKQCNISLVDAPLYMDARVSSISLKYYAFCLKNNQYMVRLHFAEIGLDTPKNPRIKRSRVFDVEIQGKKKEKNFNIEAVAGGVNLNATLEYNDVDVRDNRLEIHLYWSGKGSPFGRYRGPLISAISISPVPKRHLKLSSAIIVGIVVSSILAVILILALFWKFGWLGGKNNKNVEQKGIELFPGGVLNFQQIKAGTNSFDPKNKIGQGGFGDVYKGVLRNGTIVAVKKLSAKSKQGAKEFINEIGTSYALQHPNLVRLLGCCAEQSELLIVYEYMENNSLEQALFGSAEVKSRLNWLIRVKICRDVAKGLAYIHEESRLRIVHRDIKPTNILLDKDFTAKITDFGFAKHSKEENPHAITRIAGTKHGKEENPHAITRIAGTKGYMSPEYLQGFLSTKADVYSFGLVTLEIVSGKQISTFRAKDQNIYLLDIAYDYQHQGNLIALVDSSLGSDYTHNEALKVLDLAMECVNPTPKLRPSMSKVVKVLEGIVKDVEAKWKTKTSSTGKTSLGDDSSMANPDFAFSHSTQSAGSTSQEGASDIIICPSTSKEIDDSSNSDD
ncbi:probable LRR receptor-like serine/threonine-protein kinase At1g53420 [Coffea arabica]|uniref:non-specific serine/threonine protein kinase n=1 Tax=Coffea arabica TaxID=13443 RepID=A0ABM4V031_COFAR